jgi:hypothetical protein
MVSFKEKTQSNRRLTRLFDAEDDRFGTKKRRFRFFKQVLMFASGQKRLSEKNFLGKKSNFPDSKAF